MATLKVVVGLLFDDWRLVSVLVVALVLAFGASELHAHTIAAVIIWVGLVVALWLSIEHALRVKLRR